jgi:hypothetical protein
MNYPITVAGAIVSLAFLAHTFVGTREALAARPNGSGSVDAATTERNWVQSLCAFQLVTVDLLVLAILLVILGTTDFLADRREIALILAGFFALWGAAWLLQLVVLRRGRNDYLMLCQWIFWFICSGLLFWGAQLF